jgi:excisionase family DNA binding protein
MGIEKMVDALTELMRKQTQENALLRASNNKLDKLIEIQKDSQDIQRGLKDFLTVPELCQYIGLSKGWVYKLTSNKILPHYKPMGKLVFFKRSEIDDWIMNRPVSATKTLQQYEVQLLNKKH